MAKIESRQRTAHSRRRRRTTGLRLRHKQFLLPVPIAHYDFFALVSYAETGRVGGDCFNHFVYPFRSSIDRKPDAQLTGGVVLLERRADQERINRVIQARSKHTTSADGNKARVRGSRTTFAQACSRFSGRRGFNFFFWRVN